MHAVRGGRLSPHHLFPRPAGRARGLHDTHRGAEGGARPVLLVQRQSRSKRATFPAAATSPSGTIRSQNPSYLFAHGRRRPRRARATASSRMSGRDVALQIYASTARRRAAATPWRRSSARCGGTKTAFGREYDLDIFIIVAVSDFNMGAMENKGLNVFNDKYVLADPDTATDADYRRRRGGDRPRVFPQLDRQPHHLPRLVPALPQGRADGLSATRNSPSDVRSRAVKRIADVRTLQRAPVPRGCRPPRPSGAAGGLLTRSTTSTRRRSTRRAPRSCACSKTILGEDGFRAGHGPLLRAPRRPGGDDRGLPRRLRRCNRRRPRAVQALVRSRPARPEIVAHGTLRRARPNLHADPRADRYRRRPASRVKQPMHIPVRFGLVGPNGDGRSPVERSPARRVEGDVIHLAEPAQTIIFSGRLRRARCRRCCRGFSAPVQPVDRPSAGRPPLPAPHRQPIPSTAGRRRRPANADAHRRRPPRPRAGEPAVEPPS